MRELQQTKTDRRTMDIVPIRTNHKLLMSVHARVKKEGWNKTQARLAERAIEDHIGNIEVSEVTTATIDELKQKLFATGVAESTIDRTMTSISKLLKYAHRRHELYGDFKMPYIEYCNPDNARDRYMSEEEELEMIKWYQHKGWLDLLDFNLFTLDTGMRKGEGLRFKVKQVHLHTNKEGRERMYVRLLGNTSTKKHQRSVPLTDRAAAIVTSLIKDREPEDVVFDLNYWTIGTRFDQVKALMGLEEDKQFVFHTLRHTYASRLVQQGVNLYTVGQLMGHTNPRMTQRYAHFAPEHLLDAVDVLNSTTSPIDNVDSII